MQELLRWLAGWKGITVEGGSELQFEFSRFPSGGLALLVILGMLGVVLFVVFLYRRDAHRLTPVQRLVLATLRSVALVAAVLLLLEPNIVAVKRETRPGHTILLLDQSQSMNQRDAFRRENVQAMAQGWRDVGVADPASTARIDLARALLAHRDGQLAKLLAKDNLAQLYAFDSDLHGLPLLAPPPAPPENGPAADPALPPPPPQIDTAKLAANGRASNLGGALRSALDKSRSAEIAAVVLLSDGRRTAGPQGAEIARLLNQRKVPHTFVLGIGDPSETQAVGIGRFEAPEKVFQKDPFQMRATVVSQGYEPMTASVKLIRIDQKDARQDVQTQHVTIGGDKTEVLVEFKDLTSEDTGRFVYRVEIAPPDGELPEPERHQKNATVDVLTERTRVLLLAGSSNHEFQILRHLLIRDRTIDVTCWLQSADPTFPQDGDEEARIEKLPEDLKSLEIYDVVILMDPNAESLSAPFCQQLRQHVLENGCGLWWVAGEKYTLNAMRVGATTRGLADLLPVIPDLELADRNFNLGLAFQHAWRWGLTTDGEDGVGAKVTRIAESRDDSRLLWGRLPAFHMAFPVLRAKPAATVMVEHTDPKLRRGERNMPLVALQFVGSGRVVFTGADETYRWRSLYEDAYNRFWVSGIRWLFEGRINAGNSRVRLLASTEKLELGEPVKLVVEARDELGQPQIVEGFDLNIERDGQASELVKLTPVEEAPGTYEMQLRPTQTGFYAVRPAQQVGKPVEVRFQVVPAQLEREGPVDRAELAAIAAATGGELLDSPTALLAALERIPARSVTDTFRTPHAMWDGWATVLFIITVLGLEWWLRKRFNLL